MDIDLINSSIKFNPKSNKDDLILLLHSDILNRCIKHANQLYYLENNGKKSKMVSIPKSSIQDFKMILTDQIVGNSSDLVIISSRSPIKNSKNKTHAIIQISIRNENLIMQAYEFSFNDINDVKYFPLLDILKLYIDENSSYIGIDELKELLGKLII